MKIKEIWVNYLWAGKERPRARIQTIKKAGITARPGKTEINEA
jgi:hypothetical protein